MGQGAAVSRPPFILNRRLGSRSLVYFCWRSILPMSELQFFNPYAEIKHTENRLPHWQQEGAVYFVTFRLADALPSQLRDQSEGERATWLRLHRNRGVPRRSKNITNTSPERSSAGLMRGTARACCGEEIARNYLLRRFAILMVNVSR